MSNDIDAIVEVLRRAFQIEVDGFTFYTMAAEHTEKPTVRRLFERLARDEAEHQTYLRSVMRRYEDHGASSFQLERRDPDLGEFSLQVFTDQFKDETAGDLTELGALSIGIQLETNAFEFFTAAAKDAIDPNIGGFYRFLADWEGSHLRTLQTLYDAVRFDAWPVDD